MMPTKGDRKDIQSPWLRSPEAAAYLGISKFSVLPLACG